MIASIDTCFIIDWSKYRKNYLLKKVFKYIFITEEVLNEVSSERTLEFVANLMIEGFLVIYPLKAELSPIIRKILDISMSDPRIPSLDPPEAYSFAIAYKENCICLTENKGVLRLTEYYNEFKEVRVWRSLELLKYLHSINLIEDLEKELENYSRDTGHVFPKKRFS